MTRSLVFATFFGSCIVVGLLVAALTTDYWIISEAKRHTNGTITKEPAGKVNFGLFSGYKGLNIGYGVRPESIDGLFCSDYHEYGLHLSAFEYCLQCCCSCAPNRIL